MRIFCSPKRWSRVLAFTLSFLLWTTGCGGQGKGTVSGKVAYQGKPLPSGFVTFVPEKGTPVHADIQSDGSYRIENVPIGPVKIGVQPKSAQNTLQSFPMPRNPKDYGKLQAVMTKKETQIPPQYADPNKSGLTYTVRQGQQQYDIALK